MNGLVRLNTFLTIKRIFYFPDILSHAPGKNLSLYCLLFIIVSHTLGSILEIVLICRPFSAQWNSDLVGVCGNQQVSFIVIESIGLALDIVLLLLPLPSILSLHVTMEKKIGIVIVVDIGAM